MCVMCFGIGPDREIFGTRCGKSGAAEEAIHKDLSEHLRLRLNDNSGRTKTTFTFSLWQDEASGITSSSALQIMCYIG